MNSQAEWQIGYLVKSIPQLLTKPRRVWFQIIWSCQGVGYVLGFTREKQMRYCLASTPCSVALSPCFMRR